MTDDSIEIHQQWAPGFGVKIKLLNGRELHVEKKAKLHRTKYIIDLLALEDTSQQKMILGWKWFVAGLVAILSMVLCLAFLPMPGESTLYMASVYVVGLSAGAGCFFKAYKGTSRKQIFYSRSANVPLIELAINSPSKKVFNDFVHDLEDLIQSSRDGLVMSTKNQLAGEMKMLRRLSEENVLSDSVYKKARAGLLSQH